MDRHSLNMYNNLGHGHLTLNPVRFCDSFSIAAANIYPQPLAVLTGSSKINPPFLLVTVATKHEGELWT